MNIGIFCPKDSIAAAKIKFEAEKRGHNCKRLRISDLFIEIEPDGLKVYHRKVDLNDIDLFIFRKFPYFENDIVSITVDYLISQGKKVIDSESLSSNNIFTDLKKLANANLPLLKRIYTISLKSSRDILMDFEHPAIIKPLDLPAERYTFSEDWTESYDIVRSEKSRRYEFMEALENAYYIRAYIIGGEVIGAIKKTSTDPERKLNLSPKTKNEIYETTNELSSLCSKASKAIAYEICSIDLVETEDGLKIIDLNRSPKFMAFNKLFNTKFEEKVLDYISR